MSATTKKIHRVLSRMLDQAEVAKDASAVASLSRALLAVDETERPSRPTRPPDYDRLLEQATPEQLKELDQILDSMDRWKAQFAPVVPLTPRPEPIEPPPAPEPTERERELSEEEQMLRDGWVPVK